jgi:hypothetical protein
MSEIESLKDQLKLEKEYAAELERQLRVARRVARAEAVRSPSELESLRSQLREQLKRNDNQAMLLMRRGESRDSYQSRLCALAAAWEFQASVLDATWKDLLEQRIFYGADGFLKADMYRKLAAELRRELGEETTDEPR